MRYATFANGAFGAPHEVTRGDDLMVNWADLPSVQPITANVWAAHWLKNAPDSGGAYHIATSVSQDGGDSWSAARAAQRRQRDGRARFRGAVRVGRFDRGVLARRPAARGVVVRQAGQLLGTSLRIARIDYSGAVVAREIVDELVCDCCAPDHAMASAGPVVAYRDRTPEEIRDIVVRRFADGRWQEPVGAGADNWHIEGCPVNGPKIAAVGERVAVAWFTAANDVPRVRFAASTDGGATFAPALELDGAGSFGQVGLLLDAAGAALITWWRAAPGGGTDLVLRTVAADGALGESRVVAHSAATQPVDVPQIIAAGDDVLVAWTSLDDDATVHVVLVPHPATAG